MEKTSTKDRILTVALDLFSEKGFEATSIDAIAEAAGIKGPSLYKHFKGKNDILDTLLEIVEDHYSKNFEASGKKELSQTELPKSMEELTRATFAKINFTMHDQMVQKMRKFLTIEQFRNPRIGTIAGMHSIDGLHQMFRGMFSAMMKSGILVKDDPDALALEFVAPVTVLLQTYDRDPSREKEVIKRIKAHMKHFADTYGKRD